MCKEHVGCHAEERIIRAERRTQEAKHGYRTMRRGKTKRDHSSGAWGRHIQNKLARAEENRGTTTSKK